MKNLPLGIENNSMNQALLTRLFKTIRGDQDNALIKVAYSIIDDERRKGHEHLANKLVHILSDNKEKSLDHSRSMRVAKDNTFRVPLDKRHRLPLATHIDRHSLRHEMVLSDEVESKILRIEKEFVAKERLAHHGLKPRKKILFYGSSGCGKSMAAERIAWDLGLPFYKVRFDTIMSSYLGESASNLQSLFESIKDYPCVLLLDEFDIIGKQRNLLSNDVGEAHRIVNILLGLLEEYDGDGILIATTNLEGTLDNALFRRFDDYIELPKPNGDEIIQVLKASFSALKISPKIDLKTYSEKMIGMSYAIIVKVASDAAKRAIIGLNQSITIDDLEIAFEENKAINR